MTGSAEEHFGGTGSEVRAGAHASEGLLSMAAAIGVSLSELLGMPTEERARRLAARDPVMARQYTENRALSP